MKTSSGLFCWGQSTQVRIQICHDCLEACSLGPFGSASRGTSTASPRLWQMWSHPSKGSSCPGTSPWWRGSICPSVSPGVICIYVCMYMCIYIYIYVCVCLCIHIYICIYSGSCVYKCFSSLCLACVLCVFLTVLDMLCWVLGDFRHRHLSFSS